MEPRKSEFKRLRSLEREWLRLQGKETVYKVDVELDEIMTFFRMSLVNMYSYLMHEIFGQEAVSMNRLVHSILHLPALIEETDTTKTVTLKNNEKDPDMMARLGNAIPKINNLGLRELSGKTVEFRIGDIDSHLYAGT